jgi:acyl-CoA reductase-like NAD-dependent aldehyde dehydrogenase
MAAARHGQAAWAATEVRERLRLLKRVRALIAERAEQLVLAVDQARERPPGETLVAEVLPLADAVRFLERRAEGLLRPRKHGRHGRPFWLTGVRAEVRREAHGVVVVIGPSNYPLLLPGVQALQALAAGNAVLVKPAEGGGPAMRALAELLSAAGLDPALFCVLPETVEAGRAVVASGPDKVVLTGSALTGSAVLGELAKQIVPATVELSGCDAVFVREDADLAMAIRAVAFGLTLNGGATCISPRRVFVPRRLAEEFTAGLVAVLERAPQQEMRAAVTRTLGPLLDEALQSGARLAAGRIEAPRLYGPVVVAGAGASMGLLKEDVFAPLVSIVSVSGDEEALRADDMCPYALGASVFGAEPGAQALARRIDAGVVVVNDMIAPTADPRVPFGGRHRSGYGVTRGAEGLLEMTRPKVILVRRGGWRPHYDASGHETRDLARRYLVAAHGRGLWRRLRSAAGMLAAMVRPRRSDR